MEQSNQLVGHIKRGKRFFTGKDGDVVAAYECKHINEKSLVGICQATAEEIPFNLESGQSPCGQEVVYIGAVPRLYDRMLTDSFFYVKSLPPVKERL